MAVGLVAAAAGAVAAPVIIPATLKVAIFMFGHGHLLSPIAGAQAAHFAGGPVTIEDLIAALQSSGACTEVANAVLAGATGLIAGFAAALGSFELLVSCTWIFPVDVTETGS